MDEKLRELIDKSNFNHEKVIELVASIINDLRVNKVSLFELKMVLYAIEEYSHHVARTNEKTSH